ncbi:MAG: ABC transporter substrate-binding protein [bacterium]|nr:ABC transporter substrate-binding protein [bacterium]
MKQLKIALLALALAATSAVFAQAPNANTLVVAQSVDASQLDPAAIGSRPEANVAAHLWGTLTTLTRDGEIVPALAESWSTNADGTEITYRLQSGLTCHDGEALTAVDAAYALNRVADPANAFTGNAPGYVFPGVGFVEARADSDLEVTVVLGRRNPIAVGLLGEVYIHCEDSYEAMTLDEAANTPVGSGAYRFVEWIRDDRLVMELVEGHPLAKEGAFKTIVWRVIPEASTRAAELMAGNVDIVANVSPDQAGTINASGRAQVQAVAGTRRIYVGFNLREGFATGSEGGGAIQNVLVRRAMNHAVDVETICTQLLGTDCVRANGLVNPPNNNQNLPPYAYAPEMAEKLLDQAGYPRGANGVRFTIKLQSPNNRYLNDANVALAVGQYLSDVGVQTEVELLDFASVYVPLIVAQGGNAAGPLFLLGSGGTLVDARIDMTDLSRPDAGTNYTGWTNPDWYGGWDRLAAATNAADERAIIDEMLEVFYNDPPWLMMYFQPDFYGVSSRIDWQARRDEKVLVGDATLR